MKRIAMLVYALTAGTLAYAQTPPPGPPPGGRGPPIEHLAKQLNLNDNQKSEVQRIFDERRTEMETAREQAKASGTRPTREEMQAKRQQMQQETLTELTSVLTTDQLAKFKEIEAKRAARWERHRHHGAPPAPPAAPGT